MRKPSMEYVKAKGEGFLFYYSAPLLSGRNVYPPARNPEKG
jgi:hypothetical protein